MTKEKAIKYLKRYLNEWENDCLSKHPIKEALGMAVKALEHPQITCKDCKWWDENDRYCHACKHGHMSKRWEIWIHRKTESDFYCADAEPKEVEE